MYLIAIVWWILSQTGDHGGIALGAFLVAGALPSILLVKIIGKVVDKISSKKILVFFDLLASGLMFWTTYRLSAGCLSLPEIYIIGFFVAVVEAFYNPTLSKSIPELVPPEDMENAVAFQTSTQSLASFGGAVAGAFFISWLGIAGVIFTNACSYIVSAVCNNIIIFKPQKPYSAASPDGFAESELDLNKIPLLKKILIGFGFVNFFATPILVILPLYTKHVLSAGPSTLAILEAALWIGLLFGTFSAPLFRSSRGIVRLGSHCLGVFGVFLFLPGLVHLTLFSAVTLFGAGTAMGLNNVKFISLFQLIVPPEVKGKFFALMHALVGFTFPVAYLLFGYLGDLMSPDRVCLIQGTGVIALAAYFRYLSKNEAELYDSKPQSADAKTSSE